MRQVRLLSVSAIAITLGGLAVPVTAATTAGQPVAVSAAAPAPGTQLWARYEGIYPAEAAAVAVAPGGYRVFVTGTSYTEHYGREPSDYVTVAYSAATGARLWRARYNSPGTWSGDFARALAVSPNGSRVYVTGASRGPRGGGFLTIAYNAATGARLWVARYQAPRRADGGALAVMLSPAGSTVFVTGVIAGYGTWGDYLTVAYNAATGARRWAARYNGPANRDDTPAAMTVDPGGLRVYVTGASQGVTSRLDYATVAYTVSTGRRLWVKRYNGTGNAVDEASSLVVGPLGRRLFVTGTSAIAYNNDYVTIAYNAGTGASIWAKRYNGPANRSDEARSIAVSPTGSRVFVTGTVTALTGQPPRVGTDMDYGTVAYNAATGATAWVARYGSPATAGGSAPGDNARAIAVNPTADKVYVTGTAATVAYSRSTGAQLWAQPNPVSAGGEWIQGFQAIVVSRDGSRLFVTGTSGLGDEEFDIVTVAYSG